MNSTILRFIYKFLKYVYFSIFINKRMDSLDKEKLGRWWEVSKKIGSISDHIWISFKQIKLGEGGKSDTVIWRYIKKKK